MGAQLPGPVAAASAPEVQKRRKVAIHSIVDELTSTGSVLEVELEVGDSDHTRFIH